MIALLADKWRPAILELLRDRVLRTCELQRALDRTSPKMLTQTLRGMERDGLINRIVHPVAPPHVEYSLTKMGASVLRPLQDLCMWADTHIKERDAARARFDLAARSSADRC